MYPQRYPENLDCETLVTALGNGTITVTFHNFETDKSDVSWRDGDFLMIGYGQNINEGLVLTLSGTSPFRYVIFESSAWFRFTTDAMFEKVGFSLSIRWRNKTSKYESFKLFICEKTGKMVNQNLLAGTLFIMSSISCLIHPRRIFRPT